MLKPLVPTTHLLKYHNPFASMPEENRSFNNNQYWCLYDMCMCMTVCSKVFTYRQQSQLRVVSNISAFTLVSGVFCLTAFCVEGLANHYYRFHQLTYLQTKEPII